MTARHDTEFVGFVNVLWDGLVHAWIQGVMTAVPSRRSGIGSKMVALSQDEARAAGCEWLQFDFDDDLRTSYIDACGFRPTNGGLVELTWVSRLRSVAAPSPRTSRLTLVAVSAGRYTRVMTDRPAIAPRYEQVISESVLDRLRKVFRSMNRGMVLMWRLGLGRWADAWPSVGGRILVVEHHGRKSGNRYRTPLNFTPEGRTRYCLAAFGTKSDWYRNAMAAGRIVVWLPDGMWTAHPSDVTEEPGSLGRIRQVLIDSGFAARAVGLNPKDMTNEEIATATADYRLVRLDLIDRCDKNPADLWWVWLPVTAATGLAIGAIALRRRGS